MLDAFEIDHTITHMDDDVRFLPTTPDVTWISTLARDEPPPILISADINIRRMPVERQALKDSGLTIVFLKSGFSKNLKIHHQAVKLLKIWPKIVDRTSRAREPTAFEITPAATKVNLISKTRDLR